MENINQNIVGKENGKILNKNMPIVVFDGFCNFCSASVNFILKNEKSPYFYFISFQSPKFQSMFPDLGLYDVPESVLLIRNGKSYEKSTAALQIARKLKFPINLLYIFIYFPQWIRDPLYNFVANRRYKWFGKRKFCFIPKKKWDSRFL